MLNPKDAQTFYQTLENAKTIFITAHVGPDGDTLGSMLGLKHTLENHFTHLVCVDCVISGKMPDLYSFLPGIETIKNAENPETLLKSYDLAISVDCGAIERLGAGKPYFEQAKTSINIDHHISNDRFGTLNMIDVDASASGEVVADLLKANNITINAQAATSLYTSILTDTGGFKYLSTTPKLFELAAELVRLGARPESIYRKIYEERPKTQALMQAQAILNAKFNRDSTLAWTVVTQDFLKSCGAGEEHIEGLVESLRQINTVLISVVIKETKDGFTKISLRSDTPAINVSDIAKRWAGGGHRMAAGANIAAKVDVVEKELIPILEEAIASLKPSKQAVP